MAIALVGTMGTVVTGTTSASPAFGQATTAGNFLVAWGATDISIPSLPSGWTGSTTGATGGDRPLIYWKENCSASETAPTFTAASSTFIAMRLAEFSGVVISSASDLTGEATGITSPADAQSFPANPDVAAGELVIGCTFIVYSMGATKTTTHAYNNGATALQNVSNDATSTVNHYRFSYGITTGNASADDLTITFTITNISQHDSLIASFKSVAVLPGVAMARSYN